MLLNNIIIRIVGIWNLLSDHFIIPFGISSFLVSIYIWFFGLSIGYFDNLSVLYIGSFLGFISLIFWSFRIKKYDLVKKINIISTITLTFILLIIQLIKNYKLIFVQTNINIEIMRELIYFISFLLILSIAFLIIIGKQKENEVIPEIYQNSSKYNKYYIYLGTTLVIILSVFIKIHLINYANFDLDEGIHTYDAKLILDGKIPFLDYFTREPYYLYLHALFLKITTVNIFYSRLLSVIASIGSALLLFIIEKKYLRGLGFISPTIYLLAPFFVDKSYLANLYPVFHFIIILTFLLLLRLINKRRLIDIILFGLTIGASVHFYRMGIFYLLFTFGIILVTLKNKLLSKEKIALILSSVIPFLLPLVVFSYLMGYSKFEIIYGTNELLILFFVSTLFIAFSGYLREIYNTIFNSKIKLSIFCFISMIIFITLFIIFGQDIKIKSRILFQALLESYFFILPLVLIFLDYLYQKASKLLYKTFKIIFVIIIIQICAIGLNNVLNLQNWSVRLPSYTESIFFILVLISLFIIIYQQKLNIFKYSEEKKFYLIFAVTPIVFYITHSQIFTSTFSLSSLFLIPIISSDLSKTTQNYLNRSIGILLLLLFIIPIPFYLQPINDRQIPRQISTEIINEIKKDDLSGKTIITALPLYAIETNKALIYDNSRPTIYQQVDESKLGTPSYIGLSNNSVRTEKYISEIEYQETELLLFDARFRSILRSNKLLNDYITNHYSSYKSFKGKAYYIDLYKRTNP